MDDLELALVLKYRDEGAAAGLRATREQMQGLSGGAKTATDGAQSLNSAMGSSRARAAQLRAELSALNPRLNALREAMTRGAGGAALAGEFARVEARAKSLAGELSALRAPTSQAVSGLSSLRLAAASAAGALAGAVAVRGITDLARGVATAGGEFERLRTQLEGLTGSASAGQRAFAWIKQFAKDTPLDVQSVTQAFATLKGFGLDPMNGSLQALVDGAARTGASQEKLGRIILAVGQAWGKERLQGEEAMQLVEAGIPVWQLLSDATGKTVAELQAMAKAGELGRDAIRQLIEQIGKVSAGEATRQMANFTGQLSNLGDNWADFQDRIAQAGFLDTLTTAFRAVNDEVARLSASGELTAYAKSISDALSTAARAAGAVAKGLAALSGPAVEVATVFAVIKGINWAAPMLAGAAAATTATGAVAALTAAARAFAVTPLGVAVTAWVTALYRTHEAYTDIAKAQDLAIAKARDQKLAVREVLAVAEKLGEVGLPAEALKPLQSLAADARAGKISYDEMLKAANDYQAKATDLQSRLSEARKQQASAEAAYEQARITEVTGALRKQLQDKLAMTQAQVQATRAKVDAELQAERQALAEVATLRQAQRSELQSAEDVIRELRRRSMSADQQQADIAVQAIQKIRAARNALQGGDTESARSLSADAQALAQRVQNEEAAVALVRRSALLIAQAREQEIAAAQKQAQEHAAYATQMSAAADQAAQHVVQLQASLAALTGATKTVQVQAEISDAQAKVAALEAELTRLTQTGWVVPVKVVPQGAGLGGGVIPGYATGGLIDARGGRLLPGYGGGDRRLLMAEDGEFVVRKDMTARWLPVLRAINAGRDPRINQAAEDVVKIELTAGGQTVRGLFGSRDAARQLRVALQDEARGRL